MELVTVIAVLLLVAGVVATVIPLIPGGILSLAGVYGHWWQTGEPGTIPLAVLTVLGGTAVAAEVGGGLVAARASGASWGVASLAGGLAVVSLLVVGPVGMLVTFLLAVAVLETVIHDRDPIDGFRAGVVTLLGVLASLATQVALTGLMLVTFLLAIAL